MIFAGTPQAFLRLLVAGRETEEFFVKPPTMMVLIATVEIASKAGSAIRGVAWR